MKNHEKQKSLKCLKGLHLNLLAQKYAKRTRRSGPLHMVIPNRKKKFFLDPKNVIPKIRPTVPIRASEPRLFALHCEIDCDACEVADLWPKPQLVPVVFTGNAAVFPIFPVDSRPIAMCSTSVWEKSRPCILEKAQLDAQPLQKCPQNFQNHFMAPYMIWLHFMCSIYMAYVTLL